MADIEVTCSNCKNTVLAPSEMAGQTDECPECGHQIKIPGPRFMKTESKATDSGRTMPIQTVVVSDIQMKFGSMVVFMIKWVLASIPAFLILAFMGFLLMAIMAGCAIAFK